MKKVNYPLIIGISILLLLMLVVVFESKLIRMDPYLQNTGSAVEVDGKLTYEKAPYPPSEKYWFGSDIMGRDIYSRLITGVKITMKLAISITLVKFLISLPIAFFAGFNNKFFSYIINIFNRVFSGIPALLIAIFILKLNFVKMFDLNTSILCFAVVIGFIEWGRLAQIFESRIKDILGMNFIQGDISMGKSSWHIGYRNVLNHLLPTLIIYFFLEMSRSLIFIAQLGLFNIYVAPSRVSSMDMSMMNLSIAPEYYPEWGSMLATARYAISMGKHWIVLSTVGALFITILGFNMLGEGLKREVESRKKTFLNQVKDLLIYLSPMTYWKELKEFKKYRKPVLIRSTALVLIVALLLVPAEKSVIDVNKNSLEDYLNGITADELGSRSFGSEYGESAGDYIINELKALGASPYFDGSFDMEFESRVPLADIETSDFVMVDENGNETSVLSYREDYRFLANVFTKDEIKGTVLDYSDFMLNKQKYRELGKNYYLVKDAAAQKKYRNNNLYDSISNFKNVIGYFHVYETVANVGFHTTRRSYEEFLEGDDKRWAKDPFRMLCSIESLGKFQELYGKEVVMQNTFKENSNKGRNIGAVIQGKNRDAAPIIIMTNYDYYYGDEKYNPKGTLYNGSSVAASLEIAKSLSQYEGQGDRDVIFLFFDGSILPATEYRGSKLFAHLYGKELRKESFAIAMNYLGVKDENVLNIDSTLIGQEDTVKSAYVSYLRQRGETLDIESSVTSSLESYSEYYDVLKKVSGLVIKDINPGSERLYAGTEQTDISQIDLNKLEKETQLILDVVTHIAFPTGGQN